MLYLPNVGEVLSFNAQVLPHKIGARDLTRAMTFKLWNERACRFANALRGLGLSKGDRIAVLAYNCLEWVEIYAGAAKAGLVIVPINFRLVGPEIQYIVDDCEGVALIVQDELLGAIEDIRSNLSIKAANYIVFGSGRCPAGYRAYENLLAQASDREPEPRVDPDETWALMYTSGTTGNPKGAIRSHRASAHLSLITDVEMGFGRDDTAYLVMPMCHANSLFFFGAFLFCGATCAIYSRKSFDPEHFLRSLSETGATFSSLVPTHYIMMLGLPGVVRGRCKVDQITKLLVSSAPARRDTKVAIMEYFRNSGLFELYGSTEAGWVTMLHPEEQFSKLGSVGRECAGSAPIRILDRDCNEVPDGEPGELFSNNPYTFDGYWKLPEKTKDAFRGEYCSVGDMARRDEDGYIFLVDRKSNMIISGGENVYPSEVENMLGGNPKIREVAVIGLPDQKWGERVHAVIILAPGTAATEQELLMWCSDKIAGYKRPRSVSFIEDHEMPRTATGKIQHRLLRNKLVPSEG
jgi:fatty-acyl-CoA synthase